MVYTPAVLIIATAALNVATTAAIPIDTENALAARAEPLFVREEAFSDDLVVREPEPFLPLLGLIAGNVARVGAQVGARVGSKAAQHAVKHGVKHGAEHHNNKKNKRSDEFDVMELEAREPEPEPIIGGLKRLGSRIMGKFRGKGKHRKQQGPPSDQGPSPDGGAGAEQPQRRSEEFELEERDLEDDFELEARDFDDEFELEAREFDDFDLETREPEPEPAGAGSILSAGSKLLSKVIKHRHGIKKGVEIGSDIAQQQQQQSRRSIEYELEERDLDDEFELEARDFDDEFELEAREFDDFDLETREPEPEPAGAAGLLKAGSKLLSKAFKHRHGIKKGAEVGVDIAQQQQQQSRRSIEYELEELD